VSCNSNKLVGIVNVDYCGWRGKTGERERADDFNIQRYTNDQQNKITFTFIYP
jgi:hypothetical protein